MKDRYSYVAIFTYDEDGVNCSKLFQNALMEYLGVSSVTIK